MALQRRNLVLAAAGALAGCAGPRGPAPIVALPPPDGDDPDEAYAALTGEPFPVPVFAWRRLDPAHLRRDIVYEGKEPPGSIVIDPGTCQLTHVGPGGRARRYGVGVGREGFAWVGTAEIRARREWPDWYPTAEMLGRRPDIRALLSPLRSGPAIPGGPDNPLGARALYLWQGDRDTLYRIHGTTEPETIGGPVSSGCIRMINQDVIDLYARVSTGTRVTVLAA